MSEKSLDSSGALQIRKNREFSQFSAFFAAHNLSDEKEILQVSLDISACMCRTDLNRSALDFKRSKGRLTTIWTSVQHFGVQWSTLKNRKNVNFHHFLTHLELELQAKKW